MVTKIRLLTILSLAWLLAVSNGPKPLQAQETTNTFTTTFAELGYNDLHLQGLYGSDGLWVPFQSDWPVDGPLTLDLTYVGSPLLNQESAIVTVLADGREVTSFRPLGNGQETTIRITIPQPDPEAGGVNLTFAGHLRLTDDACEDSFNIGQWLLIRNNSRLNASLADSIPPPQLSDLPQALTLRGGVNPTPIIFVLPEEADEQTLTVAAQVARRLGAGISTDHLPLRVKTAVTLTDAEKRNSNLVVIGLRDDQPLIDEISQQMPVPPASSGFVSKDNVPIPDGDGVVQIFPSPWRENRNILLVSANDAAGFDMAGRAFADQTTFQSLTGPFQFINRLVERPQPLLSAPWETAQTTFAQLGEATREVTGLGILDSYYFFRLPPGALLGDQAQLMLHLAFSPAHSTQPAYVEVYVNDIYIGAIPASDVGGDIWAALDLPKETLNQLIQTSGSGGLEVKLSIANLLPVNNCDPINTDSSWTKIYNDSYLQLDPVSMELPDLFAFPYPFVNPENETPTRLVLPATPSAEEMGLALSMAAMMGNQAINDFTLDVVKAVEIVPEALAGHHIIAIGTHASNSLLPEIISDMDYKLPGEVYQTLNNPRVGFFHTLTSPWDEEATVLAVYGLGQAGFRVAANAFYERGRFSNEPGSLALARPDEAPDVIYREVGLSRPQLFQPDIVVSESARQPLPSEGTTVPDEAAIAVAPTPEESEPATAVAGLSGTERAILVITAFLVVLMVIVALLRMAWRIRA